MKTKLAVLIGLFISMLGGPSLAEVIKVGLEPFPPLITKDKKGLSVKMLQTIEKISDLRFEITIMPYNRAKKELKEGRRGLIGHTPYRVETKEFYSYAQELNWSVPALVDIYAMDKAKLHSNTFKTVKNIGTPYGNEAFFSELYGIPIKHLYAGTLENLLKMMTVGRINLFLFERASTMSQIQKLGIENVFYRNLDTLAASFAIRKDKKGNELKQKMDDLIKKIDHQQIFRDYFKFSRLPTSGIVTVSE
jgi:polar amino acid transport system substrate-binding protein